MKTTFYTDIIISEYITTLDWYIFLSCFGICIGLIFYGQKQRRTRISDKPNADYSISDFLLMGRQLTLPLFVATLVTTWYGGIFGVTQIAFEQGLYNLLTQGIFWYITYIIFALFLVKKIRSYGVLTLPELVKKIYGEKSGRLAAVLVFFKTLPVTYAISIGLFVQCLFPLSMFEATALGVSLIVIYALSGGLRSIVYSDVALFIIMCAGVVLVIFFSHLKFGGIHFLQQNLPASYFSLTGTKSLSNTLVWFCIACCTTLISPAFYQRCLAAVDDRVARNGILISTCIWFIFDLCTTFGAMYAKALLPKADSLHAYLIYAVQLLPDGCRGIILASIAAAIIATLDSFLFIASNILFYDLPILKTKNIKLRHALAILITASITILISLCFEGRIENAWQVLKTYFTASLLLPLLFGYVFPKYTSENLFIINCFVSSSLISLWLAVFKPIYPQIDSFYIGCIATVLIYLIYYLFDSRHTNDNTNRAYTSNYLRKMFTIFNMT